jgi:hypothetical protein
MFNSVNNPFSNRRIESSTSSDTNGGQHRQQEQKQPERNLLDEEEQDELQFQTVKVLTEDDIIYLVREYINKQKSEHADDEKLIQKADKWLSKFDVKKFMKRNPNITISDFNMVMFMETDFLH